MTSSPEPFPAEAVSVDLAEGAVTLTVDEAVYPLPAVYGAAYVFIDRCYVLIDRPRAGQYRVTLAAKEARDDAGSALGALVGEFANELLSCAWRHQITTDNRATLEAVTSQALAGALGSPSLDDLASFDFGEDPLEDPLGIAVSWEEKYKKKPQASDAEAPAGEGHDK
jgi:His-Xaa-Ser system protein HxsD